MPHCVFTGRAKSRTFVHREGKAGLFAYQEGKAGLFAYQEGKAGRFTYQERQFLVCAADIDILSELCSRRTGAVLSTYFR